MADGFENVLRRVEELKTKAAQAEGAAKQALKSIKEEFGVSTLEEAEKLLIKFKKDETMLASEYVKAMKSFMDKYGQHFEE